MKSLNWEELKLILQDVKSLQGSRLQELRFAPPLYGFYFYGSGSGRWLLLDLSPQRPLVLLAEDFKLPKKSKPSPIHLFIKSHGVGRILTEIQLEAQWGRVFSLQLGEFDLEVRLFPHGQNLIASAEGKKVSLKSIAELSEKKTEEFIPEKVRTPQEVLEEWLEEKRTPAKASFKESPEKRIEKETQKTQKTLKKIKKALAEDLSADLYKLGEWLQAHQNLEVPEKWQKWIQKDLSFNENVNLVFAKAKSQKTKGQGALERVQILEQKLKDLEKGEWQPPPQIKKDQNFLKKTQAKGRGMPLDNACQIYVGKSAVDNIALLRKAQAWDLWLHLKDYPGAHGILRRPRKREISETMLKKAALYVAKRCGKLAVGMSFEVLVAECRYVRPIKGDKVGRVTYQQERVLSYTME